jgi:hypothetical protein
MASMNSAIRDKRAILHIFLTVTEDLTSYPMVASQSFMTLIDVLRGTPSGATSEVPGRRIESPGAKYKGS